MAGWEHRERPREQKRAGEGPDLYEGAGLLDGEHGGLELQRIGGAAREALHGGGGGCFRSRRLYACAWVPADGGGLGLQAAGRVGVWGGTGSEAGGGGGSGQPRETAPAGFLRVWGWNRGDGVPRWLSSRVEFL